MTEKGLGKGWERAERVRNWLRKGEKGLRRVEKGLRKGREMTLSYQECFL